MLADGVTGTIGLARPDAYRLPTRQGPVKQDAASPPGERNCGAVCVARKTLMRVIWRHVMHGVVVVIVSKHEEGLSCGNAKLWLELPLLVSLHYTGYFASAAGLVPLTT